MLELFQTFALPVLAIMIVSYLLGSISFSIIFTKMFSKEDIRTMGSGNAGTTNVLRSVGKRAAILTFVFDILKCVFLYCMPNIYWNIFVQPAMHLST